MTMVIEERQVVAPLIAPTAAASPATAARAVTAMPNEFLSFRLGGEEYGIDILRVQEIRSYEAPTRIANAPHFIKGVVNLRGVIVPIIDLRLKLACETAEYTDFTVGIVLNLRGRLIGAVVDSVSHGLRQERRKRDRNSGYPTRRAQGSRSPLQTPSPHAPYPSTTCVSVDAQLTGYPRKSEEDGHSSGRSVEFDDHRRVGARPLVVARQLVDDARTHLCTQRLADQDVVDAPTLVAPEREVAIVAPAPALPRLFEEAKGVVHPEPEQFLEMFAFLLRAVDLAEPCDRVEHVAAARSRRADCGSAPG